MKEPFDRWDKKLDEISDETRVIDRHVTSLEHGARQPRLAMEADGPSNTKTRECTEGAATAVQAMRGDSYPLAGLNPAQTPTRPVSARRSNLPFSLAGMTSGSRAAMLRPSRVFHPWRFAHQQPLVA